MCERMIEKEKEKGNERHYLNTQTRGSRHLPGHRERKSVCVRERERERWGKWRQSVGEIDRERKGNRGIMYTRKQGGHLPGHRERKSVCQ